MGRKFPQRIKSVLDNNQIVIIYPEQEMWSNYCKPRPLQRGAYYYAANTHSNLPELNLKYE